MERLFKNILNVFDQHGLFEEGVELIGSWCFYVYQQKLGVDFFPLRTVDIDFLIPNPFKGTEHKTFIDDLQSLGFELGFQPDGSLYLWNADFKIEFLTQEKGAGSEKALKIRKLGLAAIPLRYMNMLFEDPIMVEVNTVCILVPSPIQFCLHKLIVASQRRERHKRVKDLQQAMCVFKILDKIELKSQYDRLPKGWRKKIRNIVEKCSDELPLYLSEFEQLNHALQEA